MKLSFPLTVLAVSALAAGAAPALAAATATLANGVLTITGDGTADEIGVAPAPGSPGMLRVEALQTLVNGQTFADFAGVKSIDADLGDGADVLAIGTLGPVRLALSGVTVSQGAGAAEISLLSVTVKGAVQIEAGDGSDVVTLSDLAVSGPLTIDSDPPAPEPGGDDHLFLSNLQVNGDVTLRTGGGNDEISASSLTAPGVPTKLKRALFEMGDGDDSLSFANSEVTSLLVVRGGEGNDALAVIFFDGEGVPAPKVKSLEYDLGGGIANIAFVGSNTADGTSVGKLLVKGGDGDDTMIVTRALVSSGSAVDLGGGNDRLFLAQGTLNKFVDAVFGAGDDQLISTDSIFGGAFSADGGDGTNDSATMNGAPHYKSVPVFEGFEVSAGTAALIPIRATDDQTDRLVLDVVRHRFEVFIDDISVAAGPAIAKFKGANATVKNAEATDFPFAAKVNMNQTGKGIVRDATGAIVLTFDDRDKTF